MAFEAYALTMDSNCRNLRNTQRTLRAADCRASIPRKSGSFEASINLTISTLFASRTCSAHGSVKAPLTLKSPTV